MIDNRELPIGFTMELAENSDALIRFSNLTKEERQQLIEGARNVNSRQEMRDYVLNHLGSRGGDDHAHERFL